MNLHSLLFFSIWALIFAHESPDATSNDSEVAKFLETVNHHLAILYNKEVLANWLNEIKGPNDLVAMLQSEIATKQIMRFVRSLSGKVAKFKRFALIDPALKRQLSLIPEMGYEVLPVKDLELLYAVTANMSDIYKNAKLCAFEERNRCNLSLVPDVQNILHASEDVKEIEYYWLEWRRKTGVAARDDFRMFVELYRKTAKMNGE